jgi:hypothetical protein
VHIEPRAGFSQPTVIGSYYDNDMIDAALLPPLQRRFDHRLLLVPGEEQLGTSHAAARSRSRDNGKTLFSVHCCQSSIAVNLVLLSIYMSRPCKSTNAGAGDHARNRVLLSCEQA